jgi:hypothetical protein
VKRQQKSKRKAPKRARSKARKVQTVADAPHVAASYASPLSAIAPPESKSGLVLESGLVGSDQRDSEALEAELRETLKGLPKESRRYLWELHQHAGLDEREIALHLLLIGQASREKVKSLATVPGVPMAAIRKLPKLLRKVGRQVSAINEHKAIRSIFLRRSREGIPGSLYSYARALEEKLSVEKGRKLKTRNLNTTAMVRFVQYVLDTSKDKKQHYPAIAGLINAFNEVQDYRYDVNSRRVTAASLKQLWLEHKDSITAIPRLQPIEQRFPPDVLGIASLISLPDGKLH